MLTIGTVGTASARAETTNTTTTTLATSGGPAPRSWMVSASGVETVWASVKLNLNTCSKVCQHSDETLSALDQTLDIGHPSNLMIKYRRLIKVVFVKNPLGEMQHCCFHLKGNKYLFFMLCYYMPLCCFLPFPWAPIH